MTERTRASVLYTLDAQVACLIAESRGMSPMDGLRLFPGSLTHSMLADNDLRLWHFSPLALFDLWENEIATGDPTNSLYLRGDEIG